MERITDKDLDNMVKRINAAAGTPMNGWTQPSLHSSQHVANVGHYAISSAYGGSQMVQIVNEGGGERTISSGGYVPKRELYHQMQAYLRGIEDCVRSQQEHDSKVNAV